jgi:hypothetical protein
MDYSEALASFSLKTLPAGSLKHEVQLAETGLKPGPAQLQVDNFIFLNCK